MPKQPQGQLRWLFLSAAVIMLDWISKLVVIHELAPYQPHRLFPGFNLTLAYNTGAAFSFLSQAGGWQQWLFVGLAGAIALAILVVLARLPKPLSLTGAALSLILAGALGNAFDRLYYGFVIDFIDVYVGRYHWPAFNIADSAICIGAALLVWAQVRKKG